MDYALIALIVCLVLDVLCIGAVVFVERKSPASTIAWLLVLVFLPFVGFVIYAMFGSGFHVNKKKKYQVKRAQDVLNKELIQKYIGLEADHAQACPEQRCTRIIQYLRNEGDYYLTCDNSAQIYIDGQAMFERMKEDLRQAKKHIHLLYFSISNDRLGREIAAILTDKARQGVQVRVIYDSLGSMLAFDRLFVELKGAGGLVEPFSPVLFSLSSYMRLNYRNHRKITVVDGVIGYVGGMNIGDEYRGKDKKLHPWRDTQLRLTGSAVSFLQERFLLDWIYVTERRTPRLNVLAELFPEPLREGNMAMQVVSSGPDTSINSIKNGLLSLMYMARKNIYIQTPYFTPDDGFIDALRIAARSGVDVRVMLPALSDHLIVQWATFGYARQVLEAGVKIFLFKGFIHAKTMVVDGLAASIGTANIGNRSFALNFEVNDFVYDQGLAGSYEDIFAQDLQNSFQVTGEWFNQRNILARAAYGFSRLFAPLM